MLAVLITDNKSVDTLSNTVHCFYYQGCIYRLNVLRQEKYGTFLSCLSQSLKLGCFSEGNGIGFVHSESPVHIRFLFALFVI